MTRLVTPRSPRLLMVVLAGLAMIGPFSIDTYLPSFPAIAGDLAANPLQMQQTLSAYMAGFAVMTLVFGPLSDSFGRRPVLWVSTTVFFFSSIACMFAPDIESLITLRFVQGLAAAGGLVVGRAVVRDAFDSSEARKVMSNIMVIFLAAPAFAPVIGGLLQQSLGWRSVFGFLALLSLLVLVMIRFGLPESLPREYRQSAHPREIGLNYFRALMRPVFVLPVIMMAATFSAFFIYIASAPTIIYRHLQMGANDFGYMFVPMVLGMMLGAWLSGRSAHRISALASVCIGSVVMLIAALLNLMLMSLEFAAPAAVLGPPILYIFGLAYIMPSLGVLILDRLPNNRGLASALQTFTQTGANALVAGAVVPFVQADLVLIAETMLAINLLGLVAGAVWWLLYRSELLGIPEPSRSAT